MHAGPVKAKTGVPRLEPAGDLHHAGPLRRLAVAAILAVGEPVGVRPRRLARVEAVRDPRLVGADKALRLREIPRGLALEPLPDLGPGAGVHQDRKSTRLNSSHLEISYAVSCLKKKNTTTT